MNNKRLFSTAILLLLCTTVLATYSQPAYAEQSSAPTADKTIAIGSTTSGQISGTNIEDYYLVNFPAGYFNITLKSTIDGLNLELDRIAAGRLQPFGAGYSNAHRDIILQGFLPTMNLPIDSWFPFWISEAIGHSPYTFSLYQSSGAQMSQPFEYVALEVLSGLSFVFPPSGDYVLKVYYSTTSGDPLPAPYNLTVQQMFGVTPVTEGVKASVNNVAANYYGQVALDADAIYKFTPTRTDIYMVNASWGHTNDNMTILISDSQGIVRTALLKTWSPGGQEHIYTILQKGTDYYVTLTLTNDNPPTGPVNTAVTVTGMHAQTLNAGSPINGAFTNPYDRDSELYILNYTVGNLSNITLQVPSTANYNLHINSPFYGTYPWNDIESAAGGTGQNENFTMFACGVGGYVGVAAGAYIQASYIAPYPTPDTLIVRVENASGHGNYNLTATSYPIPTFDQSLNGRIIFNNSNQPWFRVFKIAEHQGSEYQLTWSYNTSLSGSNPPICGIALPVRDTFESGLLLKDIVPEYYNLPGFPSMTLGLSNNILVPYSLNGTQRVDFYSSAGGTAFLFVGGFSGSSKAANMTLSLTEKVGAALALNTQLSGHLNKGEGILYKVHLSPGTYKFVVNRTMAHTGGSLMYPSHELPMIILDGSGNYVPIAEYYPFASDFSQSNAYTIINVQSEGDYYIWLHEWTIPQFGSETDYTVSVTPLYIAPSLAQSVLPLAAGLGVGIIVGLGLMYFLKIGGKKKR